MKKIIVSLLLLMAMLLVIGGCHETSPQPKKEELKFDASIELSKTDIKIKHNSQSVEPLILTVKQLKEINSETNYNIELISPNSELVSFIDESRKVTQGFSTRNFGHADETQIYELFISGKKSEGQYRAEYILKVKLLNSDNEIIGKEKVIIVTVE